MALRKFLSAALPAILLAAHPLPALADAAPASPAPAASLDALVDEVRIPYERFVLENGLTTIVHTDRKAPIVGVTLYYRVGSKHEPRGRTGFAHLYEHLFFGGSANVENFDKPLEAAGSTSTNGSTWYDRTNYVETVPTGALELALFMESDRMGYLLPAVTQDKLDKQRDVVKNEKRQGDNEPYGLMEYATSEGLFPVGHPYRHATIGSMADLEAATLDDVRAWFRDHYGPNNVVLVLAGDIDAATARPLVQKWFGRIPRGPAVAPVEAGPVTLAAPQSREMTDQVPVTRLTRHWSGPGLNDPDLPALEIGMRILGGLASSRLDNALVRGEELAVSVWASASDFEQVSFLEAGMDVKPGVARDKVARRFENVIAKFLAEGPTRDEVRRAVTSTLAYQIGALERVGGFGGKGATLAEGELYSADPEHYRNKLARMAKLTPSDVRAAMQRWLGRPVYRLDVLPGERTESGDEMGGWGDEKGAATPVADARKPAEPLPSAPRISPPTVGEIEDLEFPDIQRASLSNGIPVTLARRTAVPKVVASLQFDAGISADVLDTPGTQLLMLSMLDEGAGNLDATAVAEAQERLGANISMNLDPDTSTITLSALSANLGPSFDLLAMVVLKPTFDRDEVARVKTAKLADLAQSLADPNALAARELGALIYRGHPYALPRDGLGTSETLGALTASDLRAAHGQWLRPDLARITIVGDVTMAQLLPVLEHAFGDWRAPDSPKPEKKIAVPVAAVQDRIVLIDRPNSPQSVIAAGRALPLMGTDPDDEALELANDVLGGGFLSRLNEDIREQKGWSYGVRSAVRRPVGPRALTLVAPVQTDRTADTIRAIREIMTAYPNASPLTPEETNRVIEGGIGVLPALLETNAAVLSAIQQNHLFGRPDDYYETLASRYRALDAKAIGDAATRYLRPDGLTFVIVGDASKVAGSLRSLGLPLEVRKTPAGDN